MTDESGVPGYLATDAEIDRRVSERRLSIIGRERALIDKLAKSIHGSLRGHESTRVHETSRGSYFEVRIFDGRESTGRIARVTVELDRVEQQGYEGRA